MSTIFLRHIDGLAPMVDIAPASCGRVPVPMYIKTMKSLKPLWQDVDTRTTEGMAPKATALRLIARRVTEVPSTPHRRHAEARLTHRWGNPGG